MSSQALIIQQKTDIADVEAPKVEVTRDYGMFRLMRGNRDIDYNHVKRLKREMERNPHLLAANPISVNEHLFILDGQHRRQAAQELGVPLFYIVSPGTTIDDTRVVNTTQKRWTLLDFAHSYAESGREDYITFLRFHKEFPRIAPGILRLYLAGGHKNGLEQDFKRGEFTVVDIDQSRTNLERLDKVIDKTHIKMQVPMAMSFWKLFTEVKEFDFAIFMQKLDREPARELFRPSNAVRSCLRSIEDVYNYQRPNQVRLY